MSKRESVFEIQNKIAKEVKLNIKRLTFCRLVS